MIRRTPGGWSCGEHPDLVLTEEEAAGHLRLVHPAQWLPGTTVERVQVDGDGNPVVAIAGLRPGTPNRAARRAAWRHKKGWKP